MKVLELTCGGFRNLDGQCLQADEKTNLICGDNAQGKTNLIEAIWLFTGAKSFRGAKDAELIGFGDQAATLSLRFLSQGIEKTARLLIGEKKTAFLNEKKLHSPAELAGSFHAIVFSPADLSVVKDGPAARRRFLNIAIGQLYPSYISHLKNYHRALMQRNRVIKDYRYDASLCVMLDVFEQELAENGKKIMEARSRFLEQLRQILPGIYHGLSSGKEALDVFYRASCPAETLAERLCERRRENALSGVTDLGPHRDDLQFLVNQTDVRVFGSQGQMRSVALALKLSEGEVIHRIAGEYPVCLLDDVMSELDAKRQHYILNHIEGKQSFITYCSPLEKGQLSAGKIFSVEKGRITACLSM